MPDGSKSTGGNVEKDRSASKGILAGVRVLDLGRMLSGPYCTMMLADHGAEVIKIEDVGGDTSRSNGPFRADDPEREWAGYFVSLNRSKKSIVLDLKSEQGKQTLIKLVKTADVLFENFRPGVMERLGLGYELLAEHNPRLVYATIRGFGDPRSGESPYNSWPSYDVVAQAMGGLTGITGPDRDSPTKAGPGIGDIFSGALTAFGIVAALRHAEATGEGQFVDVAMYDAVLSLCERIVYQHDFSGAVPKPEGNAHPLLAPFGMFRASDGHVALGIVDDRFWQILTEIMGQPALGSDKRFLSKTDRSKHSEIVNSIVEGWTLQHSKQDLAGMLGGKVPFGPVNDVRDIFADPHVAARAMIETVPHPDPGMPGWRVAANALRFSRTKAPKPGSPPRLNENAEDILAELGEPEGLAKPLQAGESGEG